MSWRTPGARAAALGSALFLSVGLLTMNHSIGFMDRGELAAVAATWGIAHPTGYPTLMLLAGALVHLVPLEPVLVLNVFAAVLVALGTGLLTLVMDHVIARLRPELGESRRATLALLAALATSFSVTWWQQANGFEVYALHCVAMPLVVLLGLRWIDSAADPETSGSARERRRGFCFAIVTGLSFTNHLTTVLLAPGLIALALGRLGPRAFLRRLPRLVPPFLLGLLPYAWLPIRAAMHPALDWGDPHTWSAFLVHVSARDYRETLMFTGSARFAEQARFIALQVPSDFAWLGLLVAVAGMLRIARRDRSLALFLVLSALAGVGFAVNYAVGDLDQYLLTTTLVLGLGLAAGLSIVDQRWGSRASLAVGAALVALNLVAHWHECDERGLGTPEAFYRDLVGPLPQGALLFTPLWQVESPAWYFQYVQHVRDDVVLVDPKLVRALWYAEALERRAPQLIERVHGEYRRYLAGLRDAEAGRPYNGRAVEAARQAFLTALALQAMRDRPVFSTDQTPELPAHAMRIPYHLAFRLSLDTTYVAEPEYRYAYRPWPGRIDADRAMTCRYYAECRVGRALYERSLRGAALLPLIASAASFDPHIRPERVAPLAAGSDQILLDVAGWFDELDRTLRTLEARAARPAPARPDARNAAAAGRR